MQCLHRLIEHLQIPVLLKKAPEEWCLDQTKVLTLVNPMVASHQVAMDDPRKSIDVYREFGARGVLGVKLGLAGVMLSEKAGQYIEVPVVKPPGKVVDTTGAGDSFYAGLITGLNQGLSLEKAGRLGTAAAACCVTSLGGSTGGRDYLATASLAGL